MTTKDTSQVPLECRQHLRRLELHAYSSVVSALRAQGDFNSEKKRILNELQYFFSIPTERHQAEIRRAVADESLEEIASSITGEETKTEWLAEGRRLVPLLSRPIPQTKASQLASSAALTFIRKHHEHLENKQQEDLEKKNKRTIGNAESESEILKSNEESKSAAEHEAKKLKLSSSDFNSCADSVQSLDALIDTKLSSSSSLPSLSSSPSTSEAKLTTFKVNTDQQTIKNQSQPSLATTTATIVMATPVVSSVVPGATNCLSASSIAEMKPNLIQLPSNAVKFTPTQIAIPCNNGNARLLSTGKPGTIASQVVVISSNSQQPKTITIPISQSVKTLQLPVGSVSSSGTSTIFYQTTSNSTVNVGSPIGSGATVKSIPTGFTIKAFKPGQTTLSGNYIIMPKNATMVRPANIRTITLSKDTSSVNATTTSAAITEQKETTKSSSKSTS